MEKNKMLYSLLTGVAAISLILTSSNIAARPVGSTEVPSAPAIENMQDVVFIGRDDLLGFKDLDEFDFLYEPEYISALVKEGKLPPIWERLPKKPMVLHGDAMPDGIGEYGGLFRHTIGGRPEGWNWVASQHQGWGGINYVVQECLTRTGPIVRLKSEDQYPLPNLATDWEWSGNSLTMNLIEGVKWSDGDPFDSEDIRFWWEDNVLDENVPTRMSASSMGEGTSLEILGPNKIKWTFPQVEPKLNLYNMAYINGCPGPSHLLKEHHPKYEGSSYDDYIAAFPPERLPWVTLGPWTAVNYQQDEVVVLRRNPYYWKVDSKGQQLPYMNEMIFQLKTWTQRTVDTLAGNADFSNMENVPLFLDAVKESKSPDAQAELSFSGRTMGYHLFMNQAIGVGVLDDTMAAIRDLNRKLDFRKAIKHAIDGKAIAKAMSKGPFAHVYAGGIALDSAFFDADATAFWPYDPSASNALLDGLGLVDTDGNSVRNFPNGGGDLVISLVQSRDSENEQLIGDGLATMMAEVGIKVNLKVMEETEPVRQSGEFDWLIRRAEQEFAFPFTSFWTRLGPVDNQNFPSHLGSDEYPQQLRPFEKEIVSILEKWREGVEGDEAQKLMSQYQKLFTENVYQPGIVQYPTALLINKRIKNLANGMPVLAYQWAEDTVMREHFWVSKSDQLDELFPGVVPGIN
jgi:peptide/nickel transport system substrate-binding protein